MEQQAQWNNARAAMKVGVRAHDYGKLPVESLFHAIANDGWQAVQLAFPKAVEGVHSFADVTPALVQRANAALTKTGLSVAVLGVYVDPSLVDEAKRKPQAQTIIDALPHAKALSAACVGTETTSIRSQPDAAHGDALRALYRSLEEILPEAERLGVRIGIEPVHYHTLSTPKLVHRMLLDFQSPCLKIIFDPINLLRLEDTKDQNALWARCMEHFGDYIVAIHIKGAAQETDAHGVLCDAPFASSIVDYPLLFSHLKKLHAPVLRELAKPSDAEKDIAFIKSFL